MSKIDKIKNGNLVAVSFNNVYALDCFLGERLARDIPGYETRHKYDKEIINFNFAVLFQRNLSGKFKLWIVGTDGFFLERWGFEITAKDVFEMLGQITEVEDYE